MSAVAVSGKITINSGAIIDIAGNDFTNVPSKGIIAAGSSTAMIDLEYNYWGTTSAMQIATQILDNKTNSSLPTIDYSNFLSATDPYRIVVMGYPATTSAGASHNFTVTVKNYSGGVVSNYTGTVHFSEHGRSIHPRQRFARELHVYRPAAAATTACTHSPRCSRPRARRH